MRLNFNYNKTYICDLDGTLVMHHENINDYPDYAELLPESVETLIRLKNDNCCLVLITGRSKKETSKTLKQLEEKGIIFARCMFDMPIGIRFLVNDYKFENEPKAIAINIKRNAGWKLNE